MVLLNSPATVSISTAPVCQHCHAAKITRPRGLCWCCYYTPGVKEQHPSTSKYARRGVANITGNAPLPEPTDALPGTPEKLAVLEMRARLKQALWHPDDATGAETGSVRSRPEALPNRLAPMLPLAKAS
ncbi:MAG: hypothetical protein ACRCZF_09540 [Gemmataceae bacterium]